MLSCKEVSRLLSESLDRKLPLRQRLGVRMHLLMCRFCSRFWKQTLFVRDAAHHYVETATSTGLSAEARQRIKRSLELDTN